MDYIITSGIRLPLLTAERNADNRNEWRRIVKSSKSSFAVECKQFARQVLLFLFTTSQLILPFWLFI